MLRTMKSVISRSQLLDPPQALEFAGVDQIENNLMFDIDIVMDRITQDLF